MIVTTGQIKYETEHLLNKLKKRDEANFKELDKLDKYKPHPMFKAVKGGIEKNPLAQMEEEKKNHDQKMKKMEQEMEIVFEMKVKERNQRLIDSEADLKKREESMRKSLDKLERDIEEKKKWFESEKFAWEQQNGMTFEELRRKNMENLTKESTDGKKPKKKGIF